MYNWKDTRNYRRFRDENGNVIANIIYVDGEEVAVSDEVYEAYASIPKQICPHSPTVVRFLIGRCPMCARWSVQTTFTVVAKSLRR